MAAFLLSSLKSQLPSLVERYEPQLETGIRDILRTMKQKHPEESNVFLTNWNKLNNAVQQELGATGGRRRKRTRRNKSKKW
jgi:hypothetical protein